MRQKLSARNGGSDGNLYDQDKLDAIALEGKLGIKAKQKILNLQKENQ